MKKLLILFILALSINAFSQDSDNIINIVSSGRGQNKDEAVKNALRSAIEQAFGAFISSNTEVLNDSLVKDEIISVSSGNVIGFELISEVTLPDGTINTSVKAKVSVSKLNSYCQNKGIQIEIKGSLFATNLKLQKLNEEAESKAIINLCIVSEDILKNSIDFFVKATDPKQVDGNSNLFTMRYNIECKTNKNYLSFYEYFIKTIEGIAMSEEEINIYKGINKPIFSFDYEYNTRKNEDPTKGARTVSDHLIFSFRSMSTAIALQNFFIKSNGKLCRFIIKNDFEDITVNVNYCETNCEGLKHTLADGQDYEQNIDKWVLNCGLNPAHYINSNNSKGSGLVNFKFNNATSWDYWIHYVDSKSQSYFFDKNARYSTTKQGCIENGWNSPYNSEYPSINYYYGSANATHLGPSPSFGKLTFTNKPIFYHYIDEQYTLEQLEKMSFIKIEPLKL
jgi:hypothetical protein